MGGAGGRDVWIPSVIMLSGDLTYFCKYGRYFLIGYYLSKTENLLLLAECAYENIWFENSVDMLNKNKCDLRVSLSHKVKTYYHGSN